MISSSSSLARPLLLRLIGSNKTTKEDKEHEAYDRTGNLPGNRAAHGRRERLAEAVRGHPGAAHQRATVAAPEQRGHPGSARVKLSRAIQAPLRAPGAEAGGDGGGALRWGGVI